MRERLCRDFCLHRIVFLGVFVAGTAILSESSWAAANLVSTLIAQQQDDVRVCHSFQDCAKRQKRKGGLQTFRPDPFLLFEIVPHSAKYSVAKAQACASFGVPSAWYTCHERFFLSGQVVLPFFTVHKPRFNPPSRS